MDRDDYINRMETLISDPARFQKLLVPESKDYMMVSQTLYMKRILLLVILKHYSLLMDQALHVYMAYQNFIKHQLMVFQIIDQLYLNLALQHIKLQNAYYISYHPVLKMNTHLEIEFVSMIDKQDHNQFMCSFDIHSVFTNIPL